MNYHFSLYKSLWCILIILIRLSIFLTLILWIYCFHMSTSFYVPWVWMFILPHGSTGLGSLCELARRCLSVSFSQSEELFCFVAVLLILICVMLVCERMFHYPCWEGNHSIVSGSVASSSYIDETQVSVWEVRLPTSSFYKALSISSENQEMLPSSSTNIYWTFSQKRIIIWDLIWEEKLNK